MTAARALAHTESAAAERERRCIVTGEVLSQTELVRFVVGPDNSVVPDVAARLPGRGIWVSARREMLERAATKGHFSRAAKAPVLTPADLPARVEALLVARMAGDLGMARRSGELLLGFDTVYRAFSGKRTPKVLIEASDGAEDGKRKLRALAKASLAPVIDCLTNTELSLALGRTNVVHAALKSGRLSERLVADAGRVRGFRPASGRVHAASLKDPAGNEGQE